MLPRAVLKSACVLEVPCPHAVECQPLHMPAWPMHVTTEHMPPGRLFFGNGCKECKEAGGGDMEILRNNSSAHLLVSVLECVECERLSGMHSVLNWVSSSTQSPQGLGIYEKTL